jgi:hypothetical protein
MAFFAADVRDQAHAAGIVFIARMIEALRERMAETATRQFHGGLFELSFRCGKVNGAKYTDPLRFSARKIVS